MGICTEVEAVLLRQLERAEVNQRVFVAGESDVANLAGLLCFESAFKRTAWREDAVGVFKADDLVELHQVDDVGLQALERLAQLGVER